MNIAIIGGGIVGLALGYKLSRVNGNKVHVFEKEKEVGFHQSGSSVSLSDDGNTLVVGASGWIDYDGYVHGEVRIYENNSGTWQQIGSTIDDISNGDKTGQRTSISN